MQFQGYGGGGSGRAHGPGSMQDVLCSYKAGKLVLKENNMMTADPRKGLIRVSRQDDGLVHFQWLERAKKGVMGSPARPPKLVDDLIIFPGEAHLKKMTQAGPDKRLYILKFQQGDRRMFFWFQEEEATRDEEFVRKVNESLNGSDEAEAASTQEPSQGDQNNDSNAGGSAQGGNGKEEGEKEGQAEKDGGAEGDAKPSDSKKEDGNAGGGGADNKSSDDAVPMDEEQDTVGITTHPITDPEDVGVSQSDLAAALLAATASSVQNSGPSLSQVLNTDTIVPLLKNKEIQERLAEYLPEEHRHESAILELAASPQFQQQLEAFSEALQSGQLNLNAFGIPHNALTVADFLRSIEKISSQEEDKESAEKNKKVKR